MVDLWLTSSNLKRLTRRFLENSIVVRLGLQVEKVLGYRRWRNCIEYRGVGILSVGRGMHLSIVLITVAEKSYPTSWFG